MSNKPFNLEIREVGEMSTGRLPEVDEARRRRPSHKRSPSSIELSIREPGRPGSVNKSEAAAMSGTINLQESQTVSTQTQPNYSIYTQEFLERRRAFEEEQDRRQAQMKDSYLRLGFTEAAAERQAKDDRGTLEPLPQDFAGYEAEKQRMAEATRQMAQSGFDGAANEKRMTEAFQRMGMSDSAAQDAARGRGGY